MPSNARFNSSSTLRSIKSNISSQIGSLLIGDNTTIPDAPVNESFDGSLTVSELIFQILLHIFFIVLYLQTNLSNLP
jgi:hypothetical protein